MVFAADYLALIRHALSRQDVGPLTMPACRTRTHWQHWPGWWKPAPMRRSARRRSTGWRLTTAPYRRPRRNAVTRIEPRTATRKARLLPADDAIGDAMAAAAAATSLAELKAAMEAFEGCALKRTATNTVFADGTPDSRVMFIGEAPGPRRRPHRQALCRPRRAVAGQDAGQHRSGPHHATAYITNVINWRPPDNRDPSPEEAAICLPFLRRHIELANPGPDRASGRGGGAACDGHQRRHHENARPLAGISGGRPHGAGDADPASGLSAAPARAQKTGLARPSGRGSRRELAVTSGLPEPCSSRARLALLCRREPRMRIALTLGFVLAAWRRPHWRRARITVSPYRPPSTPAIDAGPARQSAAARDGAAARAFGQTAGA